MNLSPGMTPYPPERNTWQFPPPPLSRGWFWAAILVIVGSLLVAVGLGVTGAVIASKDLPGTIENDQLVSVIRYECRIMTQSVESMPVDGTPKQQAAILADQNRAVEKMLRTIREVDEDVRAADKPTEQWLADWDRLVQARENYAVLMLRGDRANLRIPRDADGDYIYQRMDDVWLTTSACTVPRDLLWPYSQNIDDV